MSELNLSENEDLNNDIAVIGMSCRFPGADNVEKFWDNIKSGRESITHFTKEELIEAGISEALLNDPKYIRARGIIKNIDMFDAHFFGFNPKEAFMTDPQHRLFLTCAWEALETAGYNPDKYEGSIGVFASMADSSYLQNNLLKNKNFVDSMDWFQTRIATSSCTLSTEVSYYLNLKGPSINVNTACSSSLVAVISGCKSLLEFDADMVIAGAAAIESPQIKGYFFQEGGIESPDGHCRSFDINAEGTVFSNGVGVVVLKRLADALRDGDFVHAVIKGFAINNDGADKVGYMAPSMMGQAKCIVSALNFSAIPIEEIGYLEAHGTGTSIGDPIEVSALTMAFQQQTQKTQFCAIGSVKANIGHTDVAAGMAGLIKTICVLKHKQIPPQINYTKPNLEIDLENTPFFINRELTAWGGKRGKRYAGVSAFGVGGTNAHVILGEFDHDINSPLTAWPLPPLVFSAKSNNALFEMIKRFKDHLSGKKHTEIEFANMAYTLCVGRKEFEYRKAFICSDVESALKAIADFERGRFLAKPTEKEEDQIVFMIPGQGSQYHQMGYDFYLQEPYFRKILDYCFDYLFAVESVNLREALFGENPSLGEEPLQNTEFAQIALFVIEYGLAKLFEYWGVKPKAMIGHSVGEYVAAVLAEVISLEDALFLIVKRSQLMSKLEQGLMLAVSLDQTKITALLNKDVSLAAINSEDDCVLSGTVEAITDLKNQLEVKGIVCKILRTSHAFHSYMMEPILEEFLQYAQKVEYHMPKIPYVSNVTGDWIKTINAEYWVKHLRGTVSFSQGIKTLLEESFKVFVELGPGTTLTSLGRRHAKQKDILLLNSLNRDEKQESLAVRHVLAHLWMRGVKIDWNNYYNGTKLHRFPLPTYPFDRARYWIDPDSNNSLYPTMQKKKYEDWFYEPSWRKTSFLEFIPKDLYETKKQVWIIFVDSLGLSENIITYLAAHKVVFFQIKLGSRFDRGINSFEIDQKNKDDYRRILTEINLLSYDSIKIIYAATLTSGHNSNEINIVEVDKSLYDGFFSLIYVIQAFSEIHTIPLDALILSSEICSVYGDEHIFPPKASALGICRVASQEYSNIRIKLVDLLPADVFDNNLNEKYVPRLIAELLSFEEHQVNRVIAYRGKGRWQQCFVPLSMRTHSKEEVKIKNNGVYLFTGGLGGISLTIAQSFAEITPVNFILVARSDFPEESEWEEWLNKQSKDNAKSRKIKILQNIQSLGSKIHIYKIDLMDESSVAQFLKDMDKKFGKIDGIVHAAGVAGGGLIELKTVEMARKIFEPKIYVTHILMNALRNYHLDFFMACSSISSISGELGQVDYSAANASLDAYMQAGMLKATESVIAINWNTWREIGMAVETQSPSDIKRENSISPAEGKRIFLDVLTNKYSQIIVSVFDVYDYISNISLSDGLVEKTSQIDRSHITYKEYLPPRNKIEEKFCNIWQEILAVEQIGITDDFFELGGHSLAALKMIAKVQEKMKKKLTLSNLHQMKTIEKICDYWALGEHSDLTPLVFLQSEGHKLPLFCIHPVGGDVFCYSDLIKYFKKTRPVYGLRDPSMETGNLLFENINDMADYYLQAILQVYHEDIFYLCGMSFGAVVAIEIARKLEHLGKTVKFLGLFDGWAKFSEYQHNPIFFKEAMSDLSQGIADQEKLIDLSWERMQLLLRYKPSKIAQKIALFKASELLPEYVEVDDPYNHWQKYAKQSIDLHLVPGNHENMLSEPHVVKLAEKLIACLDKIEAQSI